MVIAGLRLSFWLIALGAVVLYVFFIAIAAIPPRDIAELSIAIGLLAALIAIHNLRVESELADPGGDPRVRRSLNRQRERRGF